MLHLQEPDNEYIHELTNKKRVICPKHEGEPPHCQVEVYQKGNANEESYFEPLPTNICRICNIDVPQMYFKQHVISKQHLTRKKLTEKALENVSKHMINTTVHKNGNIKEDHNVFYCETCCKIVPIKYKLKHNISKYHLKSKENDRIIERFSEIYINPRQVDNEIIIKQAKHDTVESENDQRRNENKVIESKVTSRVVASRFQSVTRQVDLEVIERQIKNEVEETQVQSDIVKIKYEYKVDEEKSQVADIIVESELIEEQVKKELVARQVKSAVKRKNQNDLFQNIQINNNVDVDHTKTEYNNFSDSTYEDDYFDTPKKKIDQLIFTSTTVPISAGMAFEVPNTSKADHEIVKFATISPVADTHALHKNREIDEFSLYLKEMIAKYKLEYNIPTFEGNSIVIVTPSGYEEKVTIEAFHGYKIMNNILFCQLCKLYIKDDGIPHSHTESHVRNMIQPINDNFARELILNWKWSHCILCNDVILTNSNHASTSSVHFKYNNKSKKKTSIKPKQRFCEVCRKYMDKTKYSDHITTRKHTRKLNKKNMKINPDVLKVAQESVNDQPQICDVCNRIIPALSMPGHLLGKRHRRNARIGLTKIMPTNIGPINET